MKTSGSFKRSDAARSCSVLLKGGVVFGVMVATLKNSLPSCPPGKQNDLSQFCVPCRGESAPARRVASPCASVLGGGERQGGGDAEDLRQHVAQLVEHLV